MTFSINGIQYNNELNAECGFDECYVLFIVMLNVVVLNSIMLSVVMLNVVMLSVVAPPN